MILAMGANGVYRNAVPSSEELRSGRLLLEKALLFLLTIAIHRLWHYGAVARLMNFRLLFDRCQHFIATIPPVRLKWARTREGIGSSNLMPHNSPFAQITLHRT